MVMAILAPYLEKFGLEVIPPLPTKLDCLLWDCLQLKPMISWRLGEPIPNRGRDLVRNSGKAVP